MKKRAIIIGIVNESIKLKGSSSIWCTFEPDNAIAYKILGMEVYSFNFLYDFTTGELLDVNLDGNPLEKDATMGIQVPNSNWDEIISIWSISDEKKTLTRDCHGDSYEWSGDIDENETLLIV